MTTPTDRGGGRGSRLVVNTVAAGAFTAQISHPAGVTGQLAVDENRYSIITIHGDSWREAVIDAGNRDGTIEFRTAGSMRDGSIIARVELFGRTRRGGQLRVDAEGRWKLESEHAVPGGVLHTQAIGELGRRDVPVQLRRMRRAHDGTVSWTADAEMRYLTPDDNPDDAQRITAGTIAFSTGGSGTFQTMSYQGGQDSDAGWKPIAIGPGSHGSQKVTQNSDGSTETITQIDFDSGTHIIIDEHKTETKTASGSTSSSQTDKTETVFDANFHKVMSTSSHDSADTGQGGAPDTWEHSETDSHGQTTTTRGVLQTGPDFTGSETVSTEHPDGSVTLVTTTWQGGSGNGTCHTTEYNPDGKQVSNQTVRVERDRDGNFVPVPEVGNGDGGDEPDLNPDGGDEPDLNPGGGNQGGDGGDQGGDGGSQAGDGSAGATSDDAGDGDFGDDTGGHPGLGWDGGRDGPLSLQPQHAASDGSDDPGGNLDTLGSDSIAELLAKTFKDAVGHAHTSDGDQGLGDDTGQHPVPDLSVTTTNVVTPDPEWGDWTNPKAHAAFAAALLTNLPHSSYTELATIARLTPVLASLNARLD
jgi:hypothetical protein